jgi:hypothetical protein
MAARHHLADAHPRNLNADNQSILLKNLLEDGVHSAYGLNVFWI